MLVLLAVHHDGSEKVLRVQPGETEVLGRRAPRLALEDARISRQHARVWFENDCWWVSDLDSTHGTWVNHDQADRPTPLRVGDEIRLGRTLLVVREADAAAGPAEADDTALDAPAPNTSHPGDDTDDADEPEDAENAEDAPDREPRDEQDEAAPLTADELIIEPTVTFDEPRDEPRPESPIGTAAPGRSRTEPTAFVMFSGDNPTPASAAPSVWPDEDADFAGIVDDTPDRTEDPDDTPPALSVITRRDAVAGNFGAIFPQAGRPGGGHGRSRHGSRRHASSRNLDGGRRHEKWVTWVAVAVAGTMTAVAATAWLMYPG